MNPRLAQRTTLLCNDAYAVLASGVTHGAIWSAERPTAGSVSVARSTERWGQFHAEDRLPFADQAQLDDYRGSGFDRGHMTPSGDMPGEQAQQQTFSLANMVPQTPALNRGIWASIEMAVRNLAAREGELYVVTGPAFGGQRLSTIGRDGRAGPVGHLEGGLRPTGTRHRSLRLREHGRPKLRHRLRRGAHGNDGLDPFPALPASIKQTAMPLPRPEDGRLATRQHRKRTREPRSLLEQLLPP